MGMTFKQILLTRKRLRLIPDEWLSLKSLAIKYDTPRGLKSSKFVFYPGDAEGESDDKAAK